MRDESCKLLLYRSARSGGTGVGLRSAWGKGCLVVHHTNMSSLRWSQAINLDLSLAAACLNSESYLRQAAAAEYAVNRWHIMAWYFTN